MPATYEPIATTTLSSAASTYTFSSINQGYTDLILVANWTAGTTNYDVRVGSSNTIDSGTSYSSTRFFGTGSAATSDRQANNSTGVMGNISNSASNQSNFIIHFMDYKNTTTYKNALSRLNVGDMYVTLINGLWRSTAAINTIQIRSTSGQNIPSGTTFTLYGILKA